MDGRCKRFVICAGMRRSGSTWLYNVVRYSFINAGYRTYADFLDGYRSDTAADAHVLKTHGFDESFLPNAPCVLTTCRDIRDVAASMVRRALVENHPDAVAGCVHEILTQDYGPWQMHSDLELRYEDVIANKPAAIESILRVLGLEIVDATQVHQDVEKLTLIVLRDRDRISQLWPDHFTDGRSGSYLRTLDKDTITAVERVAGNWLRDHGYSPSGVNELME